MIKWIDEIWNRMQNSFFNFESLLIFDSAPAQLTEKIKKKVKEY